MWKDEPATICILTQPEVSCRALNQPQTASCRLSSEEPRYSASDDCCRSILWLRAEWEKKPHNLPFVGLKSSWTMWHQTFLCFITKKKKDSELNAGWKSREWVGGVYLTVQSESSWLLDTLVLRRGMWCEMMTWGHLCIRVQYLDLKCFPNFNLKIHKVLKTD